ELLLQRGDAGLDLLEVALQLPWAPSREAAGGGRQRASRRRAARARSGLAAAHRGAPRGLSGRVWPGRSRRCLTGPGRWQRGVGHRALAPLPPVESPVSLVRAESAALHLPDAVHQARQEAAVVRDDEQRALVRVERVL